MKKLYSTLIGLLALTGSAFAQSEIILEGTITKDSTLVSSNTYLLRGYVRVDSLVTLTIQPGTVIYGENASQGSLIIKPGGKLVADGSKDAPIVFTSEFSKPGSEIEPAPGDWGGVIVLGNAPINVPGGRAKIEGPADNYGGSVADQNSGTIRYVRIEYPGIAFSPNNEINGLTFGGVGSKTIVDYVAVMWSGDDAFEWFGGTVNAKHLVAYQPVDDYFDTDFGFNGKLQFLLAVADPDVADGSGSNGFESDNDGSGSTNNPRTSPTWWNVTLIGPAATTSSSFNSNFKRGMHLRRSSQNKVTNALIMGWPTGILVDGGTTIADAVAGSWWVKNSIIAGSTSANFAEAGDAGNIFDGETWWTGNSGRTFATNTEVGLADPFGESINPMPAAGSAVFTGGATPPTDGFFDGTASYVGAFGFENWAAGWTPLNFIAPPKGEGILAGDITSDFTVTADKDWTLTGYVRVKSGATLTIQPGTKIYGDNASLGTLIVQPGGKLIADGTKNAPIVFTSEFAKPGSEVEPATGDWGGVIILGNAPINVPGGTAKIEGPGDTYGGSTADDNSGIIRYVRIEYPGVAFSPNNEINGLTFGGVGNKTVVDYVAVMWSGDDAFEWFGGTVNAKHLIAYQPVDDYFDTDFGFNGKLQFLLAVADPDVADGSGSNGFESDNDGSGSTNEPRTSPTWWNVTLIGPAATTSSSFNSNFKRGMHLRRSSQNKVTNALIMGWPTGILVDGGTTIADAVAGSWWVKNSIIAGSTSANFAEAGDAGNIFDGETWWTGNSGRTFATNTEVGLADPFGESINPMPAAGSAVFTGGATPPTDGFFDGTASYVGAFGFENWAAGWTPLNFIAPPKGEGILAGDITSDFTVTADKDWTLTGYVRVKSGATLTIQPGTKIYGDNASLGTLIVQPGGKLIADGTKNAPIVFTSEFAKPDSEVEPATGDWGGVIILGNAPINVPGGTAKIEGPGDTYGGSTADDNSGIIRYVRIEYPGVAFSPNNEINGLTFGGVGNKTVVDYVAVMWSGDDAFEWFGGTVNAKHLVAYQPVDDYFDTDFGFNGKLQFLLAVADPDVADGSGSNGFESDNDGSGSTNNPRTSPTWWNVTLIGPAATTSSSFNSNFKRGMHLRRSSQNKVTNALIMGWPTGILVDGGTTIADAVAGSWWVKNSIIAGSTSANFAEAGDAGNIFDGETWWTANNGRTFASNDDVMLNKPFPSEPGALDLMPKAESPVFTGGATPPDDGFFDVTATYVGAFGTDNTWLDDWTIFDMSGVSVDDNQSSVPTRFALDQNYPNPFNPSTSIRYSITEAGLVTLKVYNLLGQQVATVVNEVKPAGVYTITFNASALSSGIYIYKLQSGNKVQTNRMVLTK